jgi:hypothetical protein
MGPPRIALDQRLLRGAPHVVTPLFVMLNLFQHLTFSTSVSKTLKQVQGDGEGGPKKAFSYTNLYGS